MSLVNYPLITFFDAVDYTLDQVVAGDASPRSRRMAYNAVLDAYHEMPARRNWRCYYKPFTVETVASATGTATYDFTGGTYERMLTRASGTWPSDVDKYAIGINGVRYSIDSRKSATVITLDEKDCPRSDLAAGTAFTAFRDTFELPDSIRKIDYLYDTSAPGRMIPRVEPDAIMRERRLVRTSAVPLMYSVYRNERYAGGMAIHFAPSCTSVRSYQGYGVARPLPLKILDDCGLGTVSVTADDATLTGVGTTFSTSHVGAVIRISATGVVKIPTDLAGEVDKNRLNPYALQRVIQSFTSTTSMTLESVSDVTLAASGYRISSRIDIEPGAMRNAFLRCCEARFATQDRKGADEREARYEKALARAMEADQRMEESPGGSFTPHTLADVAASITLETGP